MFQQCSASADSFLHSNLTGHKVTQVGITITSPVDGEKHVCCICGSWACEHARIDRRITAIKLIICSQHPPHVSLLYVIVHYLTAAATRPLHFCLERSCCPLQGTIYMPI